MTKLKAFADNKLNVAKMKISLYGRVKNTVGKGENADNKQEKRRNAHYQHFFLFPQCFQKPSPFESL